MSVAFDSQNARAAFDRVLSGPWAGLLLGLVKTSDPIAACLVRTRRLWPARPAGADALFGADMTGPDGRRSSGLAAVSDHRLLRALLESVPIADVALERFLTLARFTLLQEAIGATATSAPLADHVLGFYAALARQCFINEYVFAAADDEVRRALDLRDALARAVRADAAVPAPWVVAVAAYVPLHTLSEAESLLVRSWPDPVDGLLVQQVREPREELQHRDSIVALTAIDDAVSRRVRRQYEQNPYPRWVKAEPAPAATTIDAHLRDELPAASFRPLAKTTGLEVLIAGCGTGRHAIALARRLPGAQVLAVDLSLASLGYAMRKTRELGVDNIRYGHADLLRLGSIDRRFDVVEAVGVLHHLADPEAGWRILVSLLRPDGLMRLGLYSERGRADIVAIRAMIAQRGYGCAAPDIRRARQELMREAETAPVKNVIRIGDFFSTSECRDLLFHVQERCFTIPAIKALLAEMNLRFVGFCVGARVRAGYRARFPDDAAMADLDRWHLYETENPKTFLGMYQFWVQRAA